MFDALKVTWLQFLNFLSDFKLKYEFARTPYIMYSKEN